MSEQHYLNNLYPLQDRVLKTLQDAGVKHYLTGGTVVGRVYFHHRFSDDLDFFLNMDKDFEKESDRAIAILAENYKDTLLDNKQEYYRRVFITENGVKLKIDFVNDVGFHFNGFETSEIYYKIDNPINILSNKITALSRQAAKDLVDIIWICLNHSFSWPEILHHAFEKDDWVNEVDVLTKIRNFQQEAFYTDIAWTKMPDSEFLKQCVKKICFDIASANNNSLYQSL